MGMNRLFVRKVGGFLRPSNRFHSDSFNFNVDFTFDLYKYFLISVEDRIQVGQDTTDKGSDTTGARGQQEPVGTD